MYLLFGSDSIVFFERVRVCSRSSVLILFMYISWRKQQIVSDCNNAGSSFQTGSVVVIFPAGYHRFVAGSGENVVGLDSTFEEAAFADQAWNVLSSSLQLSRM